MAWCIRNFLMTGFKYPSWKHTPGTQRSSNLSILFKRRVKWTAKWNWRKKASSNLGVGHVVNLDFYVVRFPLFKLKMLWLSEVVSVRTTCICSEISKMLPCVESPSLQLLNQVGRIFSYAVHLGSSLLCTISFFNGLYLFPCPFREFTTLYYFFF